MEEGVINTSQARGEKKGYPIGGIEDFSQRWGSVGGKTTKPEGDESLESFSDKSLERQGEKTSEQKRRQTVYLPVDLYRWARHYMADTDQNISEVVVEALTLLRERR